MDFVSDSYINKKNHPTKNVDILNKFPLAKFEELIENVQKNVLNFSFLINDEGK